MKNRPSDFILILDFGSQYTQLITRKIRELGVYSEIRPCTISFEEIRDMRPHGIIMSGGPESVYDASAPQVDNRVFDLQIPILGICYGMQVVSDAFGGEFVNVAKHEYGFAKLKIDDHQDLFKSVSPVSQVWMSHGDALKELPDRFEILAHTDNSTYAAIANRERKLYCVQFHPEVAHTVEGRIVLQNFVKNICNCEASWTPGSFISSSLREIRERVGSSTVICGLSGGVDSAVAAALVHEAIGTQLHCIFVNTGLLRKGEDVQVAETFKKYFKANFCMVDASQIFLEKLAGISNPEEKRKIIGRTFIDVFDREAEKIANVDFLVQGTLYPDVIESTAAHGPSVTIKTHHNVGGLPDEMKLRLVEPLRDLFKDEVRKVGKEIGLAHEVLGRHPFPGPGLAVRILGDVTRERVQILQEADAIFIEELRKNRWYDKIWQAFAVLPLVKTVGVMGDYRTYEHLIGLRAVTSTDGMTAEWAQIPYELLAAISSRIINEVRGVNRVVYDISTKPPSTIEWE